MSKANITNFLRKRNKFVLIGMAGLVCMGLAFIGAATGIAPHFGVASATSCSPSCTPPSGVTGGNFWGGYDVVPSTTVDDTIGGVSETFTLPQAACDGSDTYDTGAIWDGEDGGYGAGNSSNTQQTGAVTNGCGSGVPSQVSGSWSLIWAKGGGTTQNFVTDETKEISVTTSGNACDYSFVTYPTCADLPPGTVVTLCTITGALSTATFGTTGGGQGCAALPDNGTETGGVDVPGTDKDCTTSGKYSFVFGYSFTLPSGYTQPDGSATGSGYEDVCESSTAWGPQQSAVWATEWIVGSTHLPTMCSPFTATTYTLGGCEDFNLTDVRYLLYSSTGGGSYTEETPSQSSMTQYEDLQNKGAASGGYAICPSAVGADGTAGDIAFIQDSNGVTRK